MPEPSYTLSIIWKWQHLAEQEQPDYAQRGVTGSPSMILEISEDASYETARQALEECLDKFPNARHVVLIHRKSYPFEQKQELKEYFFAKEVVFAEFGGGDDFIYYDLFTKTGLIDQNGNWAHGQEFIDIDSDIEDTPDLMEGEKLRKEYFEPVWRHYFHRCKLSLYEQRLNILKSLDKYFLNTTVPETAQEILQRQEKHKYDLLQKTIERTRAHYAENNDARHQLEMLEIFMDTQPIQDKTGLKALNKHFVRLLDSIKEPI